MAKQNSQQVKNAKGQLETLYTDVELRGYTVGLLVLKKAVSKRGIFQTHIADLTEQYNNGVKLHQTSISGYLNGKVEMHDAVVRVMEDLFDDAELAQLAAQTPQQVAAHQVASVTTPVPAAAAPAAPQGGSKVPSFARTLASIPGDDDEDDTVPLAPGAFAAGLGASEDGSPNAAVVTSRLDPFPADRAYQVAEMVRKAQESGEVTTTFSLRKLVMWGRAFYLLQSEGYDTDTAMAGAFHLVAEGKAYGEERTFLRNAYQSVFAKDPKLPKLTTRQRRKMGSNTHPMVPFIEPMLRQGIHTWIYGPTGSGKSFAIEYIATELLKRPYIRIQGTGDMNVDDLLGGFKLDGGKTTFEYGPLPAAMKAGAVLNIDEITTCPPEVLFEIQAVLEGKPLVIKKNRGEVVEPAEGFVIAACDNTLGLAENAEYVGTNVMNEAFRDRFLFCEFTYMDRDAELAALNKELSRFTMKQGWMVA